jgi:hypothetical protein
LGIAAAPNQVLLPAAAAPTSIKCGVRVLTSAMPAVFAPLLAMGSRRVFVGVWAFAMGMPAIHPALSRRNKFFRWDDTGARLLSDLDTKRIQ